MKEEIQEKLRVSGIDLNDLFPEAGVDKRKTQNVAGEDETKEVHPKHDLPISRETWSRRGACPPLWVKRIMAERGWTLEEFKLSGENEV